jgi:hypothetical protein
VKHSGAVPWLVTAAALALAAGLYRVTRPDRAADANLALRDSIGVVRALVDSCRARVDETSAGIQDFTAQLDSMRARVRELEARDPRGVAADSYVIYLEAFDRYNESVPDWGQRADTLRALWAHCRDLATLHNTLADSLRRALVQQMEDALRERRRRR